jgi:protein-S-isoprenylcysteine O-methyltransferase Ste14
MAKALVITLAYYAASCLIFFLSASRTDLPLAGCYFIVNCAVGVVLVPALEVRDPSLLQERLKPGPGEQDRITKPVGALMFVATLVIAGLDVGRYHWSKPVSAQLQIAALLLATIGLAIMSWATLANRFFSSAVRLQPDRQQVVVTTGPYRYLRHPGYAGGVFYLLFSGLALGSWWAALAALQMIPLLVRRTLLEDAMLRKGLPGYAAHAERVRHRLIPGIW